MRASERETLRRRYQFRCGYCGVRESDVGAELSADHFQPNSRGGVDEAENWVYCCHACNEFKSDYWEPESVRRVLHPERDPLATHIAEESDGTLRPLTDTGAFHIEWLHLIVSSLLSTVESAGGLKSHDKPSRVCFNYLRTWIVKSR